MTTGRRAGRHRGHEFAPRRKDAVFIGLLGVFAREKKDLILQVPVEAGPIRHPGALDKPEEKRETTPNKAAPPTPIRLRLRRLLAANVGQLKRSHAMKLFAVLMCKLALAAGNTLAIIGPFDRDGGMSIPFLTEGLFADLANGVEIKRVKAGFDCLQRAGGIMATNAAGIQKEQAVRLLDEAEAAFRKGRKTPAVFVGATVGLAAVYDVRGQLGSALELLAEAVKQRPDDAFLLNYQGWLLRKAGRLQESLDTYNAAVKGKPGQADAYRGLADVLVVMCRYDQAIEVCRQGVALWPEHEWLSDTLVKVLSLAGQKDEAGKVCQSFCDKHPEWIRLRYRRGQLLLRAGRKEEGRAEMRAVIKADPKFCQAYNELGMAAMGDKAYQVALVFFRNGLQVHPDCVTLLENMASSHLSMGNCDKALEIAKQARRVNASSDEGLQIMANVFITKKDYTNALAICTNALQSRPWSGQFHSTASVCLSEMGRKEEALQAAKLGISMGKPDDFAWARYAHALAECKRFGEAAEAYGQAALLNANDIRHVLGRAAALQQCGRIEESNAECEAALRRFPNSVRALETYGVLLEKQGKVQEALTFYKKATEIKPVSPEDKEFAGYSWGYLGRLYVSQHKWNEAHEAFKMAVFFDPTSPQWHAGLVRAESEIAPARARQALADSLKLHPGNYRLLCLKAGMVLQSGTEQERSDVLNELAAAEVNVDTLFWRGALENSFGHAEKAEACWREAIRIKPQWAPPYDELGKLAFKRKAPFAEIMALHAKAAELDPANADYHNNLGYTSLMEGQHDPALRELEKAIELNPAFGLAYYNLGLLRYAMCQYDKAALSILRARELGYAGDRGFVLRLAERVKFMGRSKTNSPAFGPQR